MAFKDRSLMVRMEEMDSFKVEINSDLLLGHRPLIHSSSTAGGTDDRLGVLIVFFDGFDVVLCVVGRKRPEDVVVLALPMAVLTAATVDDELLS